MNSSSIIAAILIILSANFIGKGSGEKCHLNTAIIIGTEKSGREVMGRPEWKVSVTNNCECPQRRIVLSCVAFQSVEEVNSSILIKQGDGTCLILEGGVLQPHASVSFSYAWDSPFILRPRSSIVLC